MALSDDRRSAVVAARTAALARTQLGLDASTADFVPFAGGGAAGVVEGRAVIDLGGAPGSGLGAGLVWATRQNAGGVDVIIDPEAADRDAGILARQARLFAPAPRVWVLAGADLVETEPAGYDQPAIPPPATAEQVLLLRQAGCEVVVEQGQVIGEIRGLEIARVIVADDGTSHIEVGVGRFDREAFGLLHGDLSPPEALARVAAQIGEIRASGVEPHPLNRLVRERWLRHQLIAAPELVGAERLDAVERPVGRNGLRDTAIAPALGLLPDGTQVLVAASVGVDLDAVPDAADTRQWHAPDAELVIAVPAGDVHPVTRQLADRLTRPARLVEVDPEWSR